MREATGERGIGIVVDTVGTLSQSIAAAAFGGFVGGPKTEIDVRQLFDSLLRLQGISTGPRSAFEAMNRAIAQHRLEPAVEPSFALEDAAAAFAVLERGGHFGKSGIRIAEQP